MSVARHHAEWLSLVESSGSFLSLNVLLSVFPQGLDAHEPENFRLLKQAYDEWQYERYDPSIHSAWIYLVLQQTLEFPVELLWKKQQINPSFHVSIAEHQETLIPNLILVEPDTNKPHLLIQIVPSYQELEKAYKDSRWKASPATRMMELLRGTNVRLGLVTNGEQWMVVNAARGETTSFISWYSHLWIEEKITLRAFRSLLGVRRFFGVEKHETLAALLEQSKNAQQEITDQLGFQVRKAVEVLVQKIDKLDQDGDRTLLKDISDADLYEAALVVMMRLVFLFCAEEKGLLLLGDRLYDQSYAVSTMREALREQADRYGEEILERRHDAWCRLLALFRAVYAGIDHDLLRLPAYGGNLFDPDRFPFLEGRSKDEGRRIKDERKKNSSLVKPLPVDNRTVLHLLEALQILQVKVPGGEIEPRRLSFRSLDVEQIGHVYEGLLDHTAVRAATTVLGLIGTKNKEPEVSLEELEAKWVQGEAELIKYLKRQTGRSKSALQKASPQARNEDSSHQKARNEHFSVQKSNHTKLLIACNNDRQLLTRILPFADLIRTDTFGYPLVIPQGSVYVTQGSNRRDTGTHYTPKSLTEEIVRYTLEPLVYQGVAEGKPKAEWQLKSASEILDLKIADIAMGSGAFLVQACRYLGERLTEAWENAETANPGKIVVAPEGKLSKSRSEECLIPVDQEERSIVAKRIVAERCIYGVDKNPLAVEMAKLSLWLETLQKNKPFTFLDHSLKHGDSLVGVSLKQLSCWNLDTSVGTQLDLGSDRLWQEIKEVIALRQQIEAKPVNTPQDQQEKAYLLQQANSRINYLRENADLLIASYFADVSNSEKEALRQRLVLSAQDNNNKKDVSDSDRAILPQNLSTFHWELEFPEVFARNEDSQARNEGFSLQNSHQKGFNAIISNPPFMGGQKITGVLGTPYRDYLVQWIANGKRGSADLCAYFFLQGQQLINPNGGMGLVATNTISQGDTREVGLDQLVATGCTIPRAVPSRKWEGTASLEVAYIWLRQGKWQGEFILDEKPVKGITSYLTIPGKAVGKPHRLAANQAKSFQGSIVLGMGFVLTPEEAQALIEKDPRNQDVLFPYLNGQDLNSNRDQSPSRWVINFKDWALDAEHDDPKKPKGHPYAADYPDCLKIIEEKVKPEREKLIGRNSIGTQRGKNWWLYGADAKKLYEAIAGRDRVLVTAAISPTTAFHFEPTNIVFAHKIIVFALDKAEDLCILQSTIHREWAYNYSSTLGKTTLNYSSSDCFETFPFPILKNKSEKTKDETEKNSSFIPHNSSFPLEAIGQAYYSHRQNIMQTRQEGLTKTYNRFHDPEETDEDIVKLRQLHVEMDYAVAAAYGWKDILKDEGGRMKEDDESKQDNSSLIPDNLSLQHGFHQTKQGLRYTISEAARREILDRLLQLNQDRYAQEVDQGLHNKKKSKSKKKKTKKHVSRWAKKL